MKFSLLVFSLVLFSAFAQMDARAAYQQQQAVQEVQRLSRQFDQMEGNFEQLGARLVRLESGNGNSAADMRAEISGLKAQLAELKREQENMRHEIVQEISRKMAGLMAQRTPAPPPAPARTSAGAPPAPRAPARQPAYSGPHYEHIVEAGQTLSLIAKGYDTSTGRILAANPGLKANALRVGQKIIVPAEKK